MIARTVLKCQDCGLEDNCSDPKVSGIRPAPRTNRLLCGNCTEVVREEASSPAAEPVGNAEPVVAVSVLPAKKKRHPNLRKLDTFKLLTEPVVPTDWIIEDIAARGNLTMVYGKPKSSKSMLTQAMGVAVASGGGSRAGMTCKAGKVVIIDTENAEKLVRERLQGMRLSQEYKDSWVSMEPDPTKFDLRHGIGELRDVLEDERPDLLILDSFRSLWGGDEDRSGEAGSVLAPLLELAREFNVAIVVIHHTPKNGGTPRGSGAISGVVEHHVYITKVDGDPEQKHRRLLDFSGGCRFDEEPDERWIRVERDEDGVILVDEAAPFVPEGAPPKKKPAPVRASVKQQIKNVLTFEPQTQTAIMEAVGRKRYDITGRDALGELVDAGEALRDESGWRLPALCDRPIVVGDTLTQVTQGATEATA